MRVDWHSIVKKKAAKVKNEFPIGTRVYTGHQGRGKTLSMVDYAFRIKAKWPKSKIFSNVKLYGLDYTYFNDVKGLKRAISQQNGSHGVLVLLDEAHLYWSRKTGIPLEMISALSQQRKDRRRIIFSSQVWVSLDIELRRQVKEVVVCKKYLNFQWNTIFDGETVVQQPDFTYSMDKLQSEVFKHNKEYYNRYNTLQKIITNDQMKEVGYQKQQKVSVTM